MIPSQRAVYGGRESNGDDNNDNNIVFNIINNILYIIYVRTRGCPDNARVTRRKTIYGT